MEQTPEDRRLNEAIQSYVKPVYDELKKLKQEIDNMKREVVILKDRTKSKWQLAVPQKRIAENVLRLALVGASSRNNNMLDHIERKPLVSS